MIFKFVFLITKNFSANCKKFKKNQKNIVLVVDSGHVLWYY